jgi:hypothetical protein
VRRPARPTAPATLALLAALAAFAALAYACSPQAYITLESVAYAPGAQVAVAGHDSGVGSSLALGVVLLGLGLVALFGTFALARLRRRASVHRFNDPGRRRP